MNTFIELAEAAFIPVRPSSTARKSIFDDLNAFKVDLKGAGLEGATELVSSVPVRKPQSTEFVRVHPGEDMTITMVLHEDKENLKSEFYVVLPHMVQEMTELGGAIYAQLYTAITRQGLTMVWPVKLPTGGASNPWQETALAAVEASKTNWVRLFADMGRGHYRVMKAEGDLDEPEFMNKPFNELLEMGFNGRVIDSSDHPICRKLRGRV
jgi:hypothetical protein